jgi:DNA-damage-inducible protein J
MSIKSASVHARTRPTLKAQAEAVLGNLGISNSEAIEIFFSQIALKKCLPFEVRIPNKTMRKAVRELRTGRSRKFSTAAGLMDDLNA